MLVKGGDERNPIIRHTRLIDTTRESPQPWVLCHQDASMTQPMDRPRPEAPLAAKAPRQRLAAIDLGSNSFHLLVANFQEGRLQAV